MEVHTMLAKYGQKFACYRLPINPSGRLLPFLQLRRLCREIVCGRPLLLRALDEPSASAGSRVGVSRRPPTLAEGWSV